MGELFVEFEDDGDANRNPALHMGLCLSNLHAVATARMQKLGEGHRAMDFTIKRYEGGFRLGLIIYKVTYMDHAVLMPSSAEVLGS